MKYRGKYSLKENLLREFTGNARRVSGGDFEEEVRASTGGVRTGGSGHGHDVEYEDEEGNITGLETKTSKSGTIQIHITHHPTHGKQLQDEVEMLGSNRVGTIKQAIENLGLDQAQVAADILANYAKKKGDAIMTSHHGRISMSQDLVHSSWGSLGGGNRKFGPIYRITAKRIK